MEDETLNLPQETFEPFFSQLIEIEELGRELLICFNDLGVPRKIKTCYGDIRKIVDSLMDYARLLEKVCEQWDLPCFHRAIYKQRVEELREIARKYQDGIGYDYEAVLRKCQKKRAKKQHNDDVGGEAMVLGYNKAQRMAAKKAASAEQKTQEMDDDPWEEEAT